MKYSKVEAIKLFLIFFLAASLSVVAFYNVPPKDIAVIARKTAEKYNVDGDLVLAVIKCESGFDEKALSVKGACGLMQLMPETYYYICDKAGITRGDIFNAENNIEAGVAYLSYLSNRFDGLNEVICAYNAGEGTIKRWLDNELYSSDKKSLKIVPYIETADYLKKVKAAYCFYKGV